MITFEEFYLTEMALADMQKVGQWDNSKNRHGYDKASIGIINSPAGWEKIQQTFDNIQMADFNLYFVKDKNVWKNSEQGKQTPEQVINKTNFDPSQQEKYDEEAITVVFTNNAAAERTPLTPWTIAHRIGHTFNRSYIGDRNSENEYNRNNVRKSLDDLLKNGYGVDTDGFSMDTGTHRSLYEQIGTMRSARMGKLNRPYEFIFECFAQFLLNNGNIKFNDAPKTLLDSNKKAWGHSTGRHYRLKVDQETANDMVYDLSNALTNWFYFWVQDHQGTTSIM